MLKIRLQRVGRKNDPSYRVVVTNSTHGPKSTNYLELLGNYNPKTKSILLKGERIDHWINKGAQVSNTVHNLLVSEHIIEGKKINVLPKKNPTVKESKETKTAEFSSPEDTIAESESIGSKESTDTEVANKEQLKKAESAEISKVEEENKNEKSKKAAKAVSDISLEEDEKVEKVEASGPDNGPAEGSKS